MYLQETYQQPEVIVMQPRHQPQAAEVIQQPTVKPMENTKGQPQNIREWSNGLCGCMNDCRTCKNNYYLLSLGIGPT